MGKHFDSMEITPFQAREGAHFAALPGFLEEASKNAPGLARWLSGIDFEAVDSPEALARLPVLRKPELMEFQASEPPFGGFVNPKALSHGRVFMSPGPVWEPQGFGSDPWGAARALFAAGIRSGDIVHNAFSYHMTPGGFLLDEGARALGCLVFPAGVGNTDTQVEAAAALRPKVYTGTPDYLKVMLDRAAELGKDLSSFKLGLVSGGALFPSLREEYRARGIALFQCYATADLGIIAYETAAPDGAPNPGMVVNEGLIVEIVRPGTGDPVDTGEVGEVVVTSFNPAYPLVRFGTGDLSAFIDEPSPCGRTNLRIKGWMGRADQRTKIKGMFVDPKQIAEVVKRHPAIGRARLVVQRAGEQDAMTLLVTGNQPIEPKEVEATLREITKLGGKVSVVDASAIPNDGKVIADERDYAAS
ncbi:MAG: AMP-binding protein [Rhizobiaceae bacterium]|nr:AMP-binding protein [Rhizobiaceae bacterium]